MKYASMFWQFRNLQTSVGKIVMHLNCFYCLVKMWNCSNYLWYVLELKQLILILYDEFVYLKQGEHIF